MSVTNDAHEEKQSVRVALDAMGGDNAPGEIVLGAMSRPHESTA